MKEKIYEIAFSDKLSFLVNAFSVEQTKHRGLIKHPNNKDRVVYVTNIKLVEFD